MFCRCFVEPQKMFRILAHICDFALSKITNIESFFPFRAIHSLLFNYLDLSDRYICIKILVGRPRVKPLMTMLRLYPWAATYFPDGDVCSHTGWTSEEG